MTIRLDEIDFSDLEFWARPMAERDEAFALLRQEQPVRFFAEPPPFFAKPGSRLDVAGPGYYAVTRHADVAEASRQPAVFSSANGVRIFDISPKSREYFPSIIGMDDPRHARLRRIVSRAFTPRMIKKFAADVEQAAARIVDDVIEDGGCDFVTDIAAKLPLKIICDLMGIPEKDYELVFDRSNIILGAEDPEYVPDLADTGPATLAATRDLAELLTDLGRFRAEHPTDDVTSMLVNGNVDGERLTRQELAAFFILLVTAGNETTRNAISHGLQLLTGHPGQQARWAGDFERHASAAVEEIVRVASPVIHMRRTLTRDYELAGQSLKAGDKVLLVYWSANRDEGVFDDPYAFDITRAPNPHIGFGAAGPHFCLGAHLARREITVMFRELLGRVPDIHATGQPAQLRSSFINGIKHLPCAFTPGAKSGH